MLPEILSDIKLGHSVFALPFALIGLLLGTGGHAPSLVLLAQIVIAMVLARSAAMAANRLADRRFDASNPRTSNRALPAGRVTPRAMLVFTLLCSAAFIGVAGTINPLCFALSPAVLVVLFLYSLSKRVTQFAHLIVGFGLALSPPAAYLAARGSVEADVVGVLWLGAAVLFWVAGFDIIYACQDIEHDRHEGLRSLPASHGAARALWWARGLHALMLVSLALTATTAGLGPLSWLAIGLVAALLAWEHGMVSAHDMRRVDAAFFTANGLVSVLFAALVGTDLLWA
ncbi:MAG: UbiA-like polyprenyltransferase [Planctomycetota bacterium]